MGKELEQIKKRAKDRAKELRKEIDAAIEANPKLAALIPGLIEMANDKKLHNEFSEYVWRTALTQTVSMVNQSKPEKSEEFTKLSHYQRPA